MNVSMARRRATAGDAEAQFTLGQSYDYGVGVRRDFARAVAWYLKAAAQGHAKAQTELGHKYRMGDGAPEDFAEAVAWYRKAAEQGYAHAQFRLGTMYQEGLGVPQDLAQARVWWGEARASEARQRGEMESVIDCVHLLVRDRIAIREIKKAYPTDWTRRIERFRRGDAPTNEELDMLHDLIQNEGRSYLLFHGQGADYDEDDPSDVDLYPIDVKGLGGIYFVEGYEFGDSGFFQSLDDAEAYVWHKWDGVTIYGPKQVRPPFGEKNKAKKRVVKRLTKVKKKSKRTATKNASPKVKKK